MVEGFNIYISNQLSDTSRLLQDGKCNTYCPDALSGSKRGSPILNMLKQPFCTLFPSYIWSLFTSDSCSPTCCFEHPCSCHFWASLFLSPDTSLSPGPGIAQCPPPPLHRHPISCSKPPSAVLAQYQPQLQNIFCQGKELGSPLTKHKLQEGRCHVFITSVIPISCCLEPSMQ